MALAVCGRLDVTLNAIRFMCCLWAVAALIGAAAAAAAAGPCTGSKSGEGQAGCGPSPPAAIGRSAGGGLRIHDRSHRLEPSAIGVQAAAEVTPFVLNDATGMRSYQA